MKTETILQILSPMTSSPRKGKAALTTEFGSDGRERIRYTTPTGREFLWDQLEEDSADGFPRRIWWGLQEADRYEADKRVTMTSTPGTLLQDFVSALLCIL